MTLPGNGNLAKFEAFVDRVFSILYDLMLYADLVFGKYMAFYQMYLPGYQWSTNQ
jgi:hypothetical protein